MNAVHKAIRIPPVGPVTVIEVSGDLKSLQEQVGGYIEPVHLPGYIMWVNDEGLMHPEFIHNIRASILLKSLMIEAGAPAFADIHGTGILLDVDEGGDDKSITKEKVEGYITGWEGIGTCEVCEIYPAWFDAKLLIGSWAKVCGICAHTQSVLVGTGNGQILMEQKFWERLSNGNGRLREESDQEVG